MLGFHVFFFVFPPLCMHIYIYRFSMILIKLIILDESRRIRNTQCSPRNLIFCRLKPIISNIIKKHSQYTEDFCEHWARFLNWEEQGFGSTKMQGLPNKQYQAISSIVRIVACLWIASFCWLVGTGTKTINNHNPVRTVWLDNFFLQGHVCSGGIPIHNASWLTNLHLIYSHLVIY